MNDDTTDIALRHPLTRDIKYLHTALPPNRMIYVKGLECEIRPGTTKSRFIWYAVWGHVKYSTPREHVNTDPTLADLRAIATKIQVAIDSDGGAKLAKLRAWNAGQPR